MAFGYIPPHRSGRKLDDCLAYIKELPRRFEGFNNLLKRVQVPDIAAALDLHSGDTVLEVGAGACNFAYEFSRKTHRYVATDIAGNTYLAYRRLPAALSVLQCDAHALPFHDATFDTVFASDVVPVLRDPGLAFSQMARVLRPHGKLVLVNGGAYSYIADFYVSGNRLISRIKNIGIKKGNIPPTYQEYHSRLVAMHGTNHDFFVDREKYLERFLEQTGFCIAARAYSVRGISDHIYQLLCFAVVCLTGRHALSRRYIRLLPFLRFFNYVSKGKRGMALIVTARKKAQPGER